MPKSAMKTERCVRTTGCKARSKAEVMAQDTVVGGTLPRNSIELVANQFMQYIEHTRGLAKGTPLHVR